MKRYKESTLFLLPLINSSEYFLDKEKIITDNFISTYIKDLRFPFLDNSVVLLYKGENKNLDLFEKRRLEGKTYDMNGLVTYHISINETLPESDYKKIIDGKYSELSTDAKFSILDFWEVNKYSFLWGILFKTPYAKLLYLQHLRKLGIEAPLKLQFEYWQKPNLTKETYCN